MGKGQKSGKKVIKAEGNASTKILAPSSSSIAAPQEQTVKSTSKLSNLQQKFQQKLEGARFRTINERLYTCTGDTAFTEFQQNQSLFDIVCIDR
jgi:hypothetical protein